MVAPDDDPSLIGRTLSHFRIESKLGEGGMGVVYRALDLTLRREVALKVLPDSVAGDYERRRRLLREAQAAAAVTHANIATVYEVGDAEGHVFIAMELITGDTLRNLIAAGLLHADALRIAGQIARGLARAHEKGIVHRDLKPENVMVTADGDVKILDFGLAKLRDVGLGDPATPALSHLTLEGRMMGTPAYMSPEQADGKLVDSRSDVFSFGIMLYEMLAGVIPFDGSTTISILFAVVHGEPRPLASVCPGVPPAAAEIVARCLQKDPALRFASGRDLSLALERGSAVDVVDSAPGRAPASVARVLALGTELGATIAADVQPGRRPAGFLGLRSRRVLGIALAALALGGGGAAWQRHTHATAPSHPATPTPALVGVAMTDHPPPKASTPEAVVHYAAGLSRMRIGALQSFREFRHAAALDPTLAAAQLRLALYGAWEDYSPAERRSSYVKAFELAASLEARDRELLPVAEAAAAEVPDFRKARELTRAALERHPTDAELPLLDYVYSDALDDRAGTEAAARRVLELDPVATQVLAQEGYSAFFYLGDARRAADLFDRCLAVSPGATLCQIFRAKIDAEMGKCDASLEESRQLVKLEPDSDAPYRFLARALAATGVPLEGVRSALEQADARLVPSAATPAGLSGLALATLAGDFPAADRAAAALEQALAASSSERLHSNLTGLRIALAEESGDRAKALSLAEEFTKQASAWTGDAPDGVRMKREYLLHEAGKESDAAFAAAVDHLLADSNSPRDHRRLLIDAMYAQSPDEVKAAALPAAPLPISNRELRESSLRYGRLLFLRGRVDEAIPLLTMVSQSCGVMGEMNASPRSLEATLDYFHAHLLLGQALETVGDKAGACRSYSIIRTGWKNAKPRSVTLDTANERARALSCSIQTPDTR